MESKEWTWSYASSETQIMQGMCSSVTHVLYMFCDSWNYARYLTCKIDIYIYTKLLKPCYSNKTV